MAYDSVRAQLDKLLGPDRNGPLTNTANHEPPNYRDSKYCKHFLLGFCPNDLYIKQRSEPGSCRCEHSEAAKQAFDEDDQKGRVREEKSRWMRLLLNECQNIVSEEDRKIRGQARRLQESYGCGGDLTALMIRNFDTLKKLGMVSQNAKIRILSEIDDDEIMSNDDATLPHTSMDPSADGSQDVQQLLKLGNNVKQPDHPSVNAVDENKANQNPNSEEKELDKSSSDSGTDDDDDDDLDGFGLIKVIPASDTPVNKAGDADASKASQPPHQSNADTKVVPSKESSQSLADDVKAPVSDKKPPEEQDKQDSDKESDSQDGMKEDTKPLGVSSNPSITDHEPNTTEQFPNEKDGKTETHTNDVKTNAFEVEKSDDKPAEQESNTNEETDNVMDKFYEAGVGPDGLLMLDRKQSKRVCACCGGYISLVDAESRLLSHYGGKSHHSLALLRKKIPDLETIIASEPRYAHETNANRYSRADDRDHGRNRHSDDWRTRRDYRGGKRSGRYEDRYSDRYGDVFPGKSNRDSYRRHGASDWHRNSADDYDKYGSRYNTDGYNDDRPYGRHDRYEGRRKRYRSPSPYRGSRRRRRYY
ncbi:Luc7-like protein [Gracilariopsis chorda]|uniref:Luc7-like protein n=1 Tax=Gracilariopsis chorda TaxID=448386 RepID=A0A2V3J6A9_9FLOR|nr:Luc7-like protein [Gracilariopsis chorda]|eukprot:PXF49961.1 Luc7-like protein [Gracilariopsis chorda]